MPKIIQNKRPVNQVGFIRVEYRQSFKKVDGRHHVRTPLKLARSVNGLPLRIRHSFGVKTINYKLDDSGRSIQLDANQQPMLETRWTYTRGVWRLGCTTVDLRYGTLKQ